METPEALTAEVRQLLANGQKIEAVKRIRQELGLGLAEAVHLADWIAKGDTSAPIPLPAKAVGNPLSNPPPFRPQRGSSIAALVFLLVGLLFAGIGAGFYFFENGFRKTSTSVEGTVVENIRSGRSFRPVFEYPWQGQPRRGEGNFSGSVNSRPVYKIGEKVPLRVDPSDLETVHIDTFFGTWLFPLVFGGLGTIFMLIGGSVLVVTRRK